MVILFLDPYQTLANDGVPLGDHEVGEARGDSDILIQLCATAVAIVVQCCILYS